MNEDLEIRASRSWRNGSELLSGLKVLEISTGVSAAYATSVLASLGCEVARLDTTTAIRSEGAARQAATDFLHRGKSAIGQETLAAAMKGADIVIVDTSPQLAQLRERVLAPDALKSGAIPLIFAFASVEEDASRNGSALTSEAAAALSISVGEANGAPLTLPCNFSEYQAGISGVSAGLAALLGRASPLILPIEVSVRDVVARSVGTLAQNFLPYGRPWRRDGTRPPQSGGVYPCGLFPCKDGYVAIYCRGSKEWIGLINAMGNPEWSRDPRFEDPRRVAVEYADEADSHLLPWLSKFTREEVTLLAGEYDFPACGVRYIEEIFADEQFQYRGSFETFDVAASGQSILMPSVPWRIAGDVNGGSVQQSQATESTTESPAALLDGVRVLDLTWVWSGPMLTSQLVDLGAEVIKVEHTSRLDSLRLRGKPLHASGDGPAHEMNPWFNQVNHGKKSVLIDIKSEAGREQVLQLVESCDVVVENMRPGALTDAGLGYDQLAKRNPGIVLLSMSMAGQEGPLAGMKGYAGLMSSQTGMESLVGYRSDKARAPFVGMATPALGDPNGAEHGMAVLLAALYRRRHSGAGAWIDLSQTDAMLALMPAPVAESQLAGHVKVRGNAAPEAYPHGIYACEGEDDWVSISVSNDTAWARLTQVIGGTLYELRGLDFAGRQLQQNTIEVQLESWFRSRSKHEAAEQLRALDVDCEIVASYEEMLQSEWRSARGLTRSAIHPYIGPQEIFVVPWHFGGRSAGVAKGAPLLGEHTDEVLASMAGGAIKSA